jgi:hypothetical protein
MALIYKENKELGTSHGVSRPLRQQDSNGPSGPVLLLPRAGKRFFTNGRAHGGRTFA